ncbi:MAG: glycosyltransferase family 4 protein [Bacteroidetes bacterium]|nr:glycosyltransferase family 4 protein [Bacteroidota bacterium]
MRVLIDEGLTYTSQSTGIGHHGHNIYLHLNSYCNCEITNYWYLKIIPRGLRKFAYVSFTNIHAFYKNYDIIHYQNYNTPYLSGKAKKVVTIHDLGVFRYPDTVPTIYIKYNQSLIKNSVTRADAIITPSEFTKEEILSYFPNADEQKIFSCESGLRDVFFKGEVFSDVIEKNGIDKFNYFFFLGSISKRKNLEFLIKAFIKAKQKKAIGDNIQLILGGQNWWGAKNIIKLIDPKMKIITLGYLTDEDIMVLYRNSKAVIFPSIYEGFGSPIIEAMSQNAPLIISKIPTSISLNKRHNNQMFEFDLGNEEQLIEILSDFDKKSNSIKAKLNYGDISIYNFDSIAKKHFDVYKTL